jgi:hypothetical protein
VQQGSRFARRDPQSGFIDAFFERRPDDAGDIVDQEPNRVGISLHGHFAFLIL